MSDSSFTNDFFIGKSNIRLHYVVGKRHASQPWLVFLHGFPENSIAWYQVMPVFYQQNYNVVALDLRGAYLSDTPCKTRDYRFDLLVEDIKQLIHLLSPNDPRAYLIGHDSGAALSWVFAERYPEYCRGIVVVNSPHPGCYSELFRMNPFLSVRQTWRFWYMYFFQLWWLPELIMTRLNYFWLDYIFRRWMGVEKVNVSKLLAFYKKIFRVKRSVVGVLGPYRANVFGHYGRRLLKPFLKQHAYKNIVCPVHVVWGGYDFVLENGLLQSLPQFCQNEPEITVIQKGGHWLHHEYPEQVIQCIQKLVEAGNSSSSPPYDITEKTAEMSEALLVEYHRWLKLVS